MRCITLGLCSWKTSRYVYIYIIQLYLTYTRARAIKRCKYHMHYSYICSVLDYMCFHVHSITSSSTLHPQWPESQMAEYIVLEEETSLCPTNNSEYDTHPPPSRASVSATCMVSHCMLSTTMLDNSPTYSSLSLSTN